MRISQAAFDLIVREEVTSRAYYERHYTRPEWPGGASGITIGIGYDLGYANVAKIKADWDKHVAPEVLSMMFSCAGLTGQAAHAALSGAQGIVIGWDAAIDVFANRDVPSWTSAVMRRIAKADALTPSCLGTVVSIAYNRGASFDNGGDRYSEMRAIKQHINASQLIAVAADIRSMKRLWPTVKGLRDRRDHEAALWEKGLAETVQSPTVPDAADPQAPLKAGPARTKPPATTTAQHGTTGAVIVAGTVAAQQAHAHGLLSSELAIFVGFLATLGGITAWLLWYRNRNPK